MMRDKAEMADANERLEHIVLQLQGESDTIGGGGGGGLGVLGGRGRVWGLEEG